MVEMAKCYLSALWADVVARMSGLASVIFTFASVYSNAFNGVPGMLYARKFWGVAAVGCFIYANYRLWADEHRKLISQMPEFRFNLEQVDWQFQADINETIIIIAVNLSNVGAPSAALNWRGFLVVGGVKEALKGIQITRGWILPDPAKKNPIVILPEHQISYKTAQGRIETGAIVLGRSFHSAPGNKEIFMNSLNWSIELICDDFRGVHFTGTFYPHPGSVMERKSFPGELPLTSETFQLIGGNEETRIQRRPESSGEVGKDDDEGFPLAQV